MDRKDPLTVISPQMERVMSKKPVKKPDLRDGNAPATTVTNTDERLAGAEQPSVSPTSGDPHMVRPDVGRNIPPGQATKG